MTLLLLMPCHQVMLSLVEKTRNCNFSGAELVNFRRTLKPKICYISLKVCDQNHETIDLVFPEIQVCIYLIHHMDAGLKLAIRQIMNLMFHEPEFDIP